MPVTGVLALLVIAILVSVLFVPVPVVTRLAIFVSPVVAALQTVESKMILSLPLAFETVQ